MNKIAIIIPAYNERENLKKLVDQINSNLNDIQILIIDDSKVNDSEQTIIDKKNVHFIYRGKKLGRGSAVLFGLKECLKKDYNIFIEMDADFSHDPNELQDKIDFFVNNNLDVLIASRYLKNSKIVNWSLSRRIFSKLSNFLAKKLLRIPVSDYTNGYRLYSREAVQLITRECGKIGDGFIVLSEILLVTSLNKLKIGEISSVFINRIRGESSVNVKLIFLSLFGLLKLFILKIKKL
jgi:dolichol-phosphate mannosyltransferase